MKHLFLFTLGPVQSFIAQARKTQDLFAGSKILSDLIGFAMKQLPQDTEFVFPTDINASSKPNRFVAIVKSEDIQKLGDELKCSVEKEFYEGKDFGKLVNDIYDCKDQLKDFLKVYWVAKVFDENRDYPSQYKEIEQLLGAVKNIRYFNQFAEKGRKCSINGEYNVKFYRKNEKEKSRTDQDIQDKKLFDAKNKVVGFTDYREISQAQLQAGEGLCAVSFLKRVYKSKNTTIESFPSVAEIALKYDIQQLSDELKDCLTEYQDKVFKENEFMSLCIKELSTIKVDKDTDLNTHFDYQLVYSESINEKNFPFEPQRKIAERYVNKWKDHLKCKYYSILAFDADGMGSKLGSANSKEEHQKISELLGNFATKAQEYIDNNDFGKTVYAGGDDFLGFLNLNHLFEAMQELRQLFDDEVNKELDKLGYSHLKLTFSAGIAIAHYKTPLSEVLTWARAMEKEAKKIDKTTTPATKNAFGIAVLKHSGEIHKTLWKWTYSTHDLSRGLGEVWMTDLAKTLTDYLKDKKVSDKFISNLSIEFENLMNPQGELPKSHDPILDIELRRLAERARNKQQLSEKDLKELMTKFYQIYVQFRDFQGLQNLLNLFHICEFVGRHLNKKQSIPQPTI